MLIAVQIVLAHWAMGFGGGACVGGTAGVVEAVRTGTVSLRGRQPIKGGISECPRLVVRLEVSFDRDRSLPAIQVRDMRLPVERDGTRDQMQAYRIRLVVKRRSPWAYPDRWHYVSQVHAS
jgi:hypothetical protein